jgi:hypothetical protein|tara:strand:- start:330 stop:602 length:273 start_codon:yes stop_codon:yes gene_type:complete
MSKPSSVTDYVYLAMRNGQWWTFWELQDVIKNNVGKFYGEPTISAAIRELRKYEPRKKYGLPLNGEIVIKRKIKNKKGNEYRLITGDNNV